MSKKHEYGGQTFYLKPATNGYLVVTHGNPIGGGEFTIVGYVGTREDGTTDQPFGMGNSQ